MLPGEREKAFQVRLKATEFASENHAIFRAVAVTPFDNYVDADSRIF
jgi:hypothetical protein